jgi:hypothetical protein
LPSSPPDTDGPAENDAPAPEGEDEGPGLAALPAPPLYPAAVSEVVEGGARWIIKTYALNLLENPAGISREPFERDGWGYALTDITRTETASADVKEHIETVSVNTATKDMAAILAQLAPTMEYSDVYGYGGLLTLDASTIQVATAGTRSSPYTVTATRTYPYLSSNDPSLLPKTVAENGRTLTLSGVAWQSEQRQAVDYSEVPLSYTATATYTASGTSTTATGYVATAQYKGRLGKLVTGRTVYKAYFMGTELSTARAGLPGGALLPALLFMLALAALGAAAYAYLWQNVKVYNLKDGKFRPAGKTRVSPKVGIIDLTPFTAQAASGSFMLVINRPAAKGLAGRTVTVNYGDSSLQHTIQDGSGEYQFQIDF